MTINTFFRIHHFKAAIRLEVGFYCRHAYSHAASIAKNLNKHTEEHAQQLLQHCCKNETKLKTFFPLKKKKETGSTLQSHKCELELQHSVPLIFSTSLTSPTHHGKLGFLESVKLSS